MTAPGAEQGGRYLFGDCVLDTGARELRVGAETIELEPRTFDVLAYLVEHRDRVVPKAELLDTIWGDRFVGESALATQIKHARAAIGDDGRAQATIRTIHRVGYRFVAGVTSDAEVDPGRTGRASPASSAWASPTSKAMFGRDADLDLLEARIDEHRLVTVTGPAGVGKTSLAQRLLTERLPVGARLGFCELADTRNPDAVANVVLAAMGEGQHSDADPAESVLRILEERHGCLVLDNCEHLAGAAAELAAAVLGRCPGVTIVATSRQPLGLPEEAVHALDPLDVDAAIACFAARATAAGATVDPEDPALRDLCARLDGIPLAIELAAARSRLLSPREMLELLDDRFRLLRTAGGPGGGDISLHAAIASSWDALDDDSRDLLARLSVFVGGFALDDARSVAMPGADPLDAVDALEQLVRCSLLSVDRTGGTRTTFRLLESVREFAASQLADPEEVQRAHVAHFVARTEQLDAACQTPDVDDALAELRATWGNLRAAVGYAWGLGDTTAIRRIVCAASEYADLFAVYEIGDWCELAGLEGDLSAEDELALAADTLAVKARTLAHQGHHDRAQQLADRAREHHESHATVLTSALCAYYGGRLDEVVELAPTLGALSRSGRGLDSGYADGFAAIVTTVRREVDLTTTTIEPAHAEDGVMGALETMNEGLRLCTADPGRAADLLDAVVEASLRRDYRLLAGIAASTLTQVTLPARPRAEAIEVLRRTLVRYRERSMWALITADIVMAARFLVDAGMSDLAARLIGARLASGYAVGLSELHAAALREELASSLGEDYPTLVDQGRAWRPPEAATRAIEGLTAALRDTT